MTSNGCVHGTPDAGYIPQALIQTFHVSTMAPLGGPQPTGMLGAGLHIRYGTQGAAILAAPGWRTRLNRFVLPVPQQPPVLRTLANELLQAGAGRLRAFTVLADLFHDYNDDDRFHDDNDDGTAFCKARDCLKCIARIWRLWITQTHDD